jgi:putative pyruvate formate lyase activating enzyme
MEGKVDIYLPDLKYVTEAPAARYSAAPGYFDAARRALPIMAEQVGGCDIGADGIMRRGMIVRHLILPGQHRASMDALSWIRDHLPPWVMVSVMSQYLPMGRASEFREINRRITTYEYNAVLDHMERLGMENGYIQERSSAKEDYVPDFALQGVRDVE